MVTLLDRTIEAISPSWALQRAAARTRLEAAKRGFKAASRDRRAAGWVTVGAQPSTAASAELATLRQRSDQMLNDNPYWGKGVRVIVNHTVGQGVRATVTGPNRAIAQQVQARFDAWARSTACDVTGRSNFFGLQKLYMRTVVQSGECLARNYFSRKGELSLQLLGPDFLDATQDKLPPQGPRTIGGVECDSFGKPIAYHLLAASPDSLLRTSNRVPAMDILQGFDLLRVGQQRGIPWVANVFTRLVDWDEFEDAELMRQKVAAAFGLVYTGVTSDDKTFTAHDKLEPGMIEYLPQGAQVTTVTPPANQGLGEMAKISHRAIAAGLGITYEALTNDYSNVNFSSSRMANLAMAKNVEGWQQNTLGEMFLDRVFAWFTAGLSLAGGIPRARECSVEWAYPAADLVDPNQENKATIAEVRGGLQSLSGALRARGRDPARIFAEIKADIEALDAAGLTLDTDPRKVSLQGQGAVNSKEGSPENGGNSEKNT